MSLVFATHFAATCFMTGVIWFVQVVHYPLFTSFDPNSFSETMTRHQSLTTWIVGPAMLLELATGVWLLQAGSKGWLPVLNVALLVLTWLATFFISVPLHSTLAQGFDADTATKLVTTNWWRTILWSARCLLILAWRIGA